jgi:hypothetical protein
MIELKDNTGNVTCTLDPQKAPYWFKLETTYGEKTYTLKFNYLRDKETHEKDKTKITGAQLQ